MIGYDKLVKLSQLESATQAQRDFLEYRIPRLDIDTDGNLSTITWSWKDQNQSFQIVDGSDLDVAIDLLPKIEAANTTGAQIWQDLTASTATADASKEALDLTVLAASHGAASIEDAIETFDEMAYTGQVGMRLDTIETALLTDQALPSALVDDDGVMLDTGAGIVLSAEDAAPWVTQLKKQQKTIDSLLLAVDTLRSRIRRLEVMIERWDIDPEYLIDLASVIEGKALLEV